MGQGQTHFFTRYQACELPPIADLATHAFRSFLHPSPVELRPPPFELPTLFGREQRDELLPGARGKETREGRLAWRSSLSGIGERNHSPVFPRENDPSPVRGEPDGTGVLRPSLRGHGAKEGSNEESNWKADTSCLPVVNELIGDLKKKRRTPAGREAIGTSCCTPRPGDGFAHVTPQATKGTGSHHSYYRCNVAQARGRRL
jgi:hypothetical protein